MPRATALGLNGNNSMRHPCIFRICATSVMDKTVNLTRVGLRISQLPNKKGKGPHGPSPSCRLYAKLADSETATPT